MLNDLILNLQDFVYHLPGAVQWLGLIAISAIPFVESYFGSAIGVIIGLNPVLAVALAVAGNIVSMLVFVLLADRGRRQLTSPDKEPKRRRLKKMFDRFGVPGVSLLGQAILPSQLTSAAMVSFDASTRQVIIWQLVSICLWGVAFTVLASLGVNLITG